MKRLITTTLILAFLMTAATEQAAAVTPTQAAEGANAVKAGWSKFFAWVTGTAVVNAAAACSIQGHFINPLNAPLSECVALRDKVKALKVSQRTEASATILEVRALKKRIEEILGSSLFSAEGAALKACPHSASQLRSCRTYLIEIDRGWSACLTKTTTEDCVKAMLEAAAEARPQ